MNSLSLIFPSMLLKFAYYAWSNSPKFTCYAQTYAHYILIILTSKRSGDVV